jgi:hypothetical protein
MAGVDCRLPMPDGPVGGASSELPLPTGDNRCLVVRPAAVELPGQRCHRGVGDDRCCELPLPGATVSVDCGARVRADRHSAAVASKGMAGWEDWERTARARVIEW